MRLVDADELIKDDEVNLWLSNDAVRTGKTLKMFSELFIKKINEQPTVEAITKDQYEARLKADMVAMLTDIQLEIEELDSRAGYDGGGMPTFSTDYIRKKKVNELVQQKIDALKVVKDGTNN